MAPPRFLHHASAGLAILHKTPWRCMLLIRDKVEAKVVSDPKLQTLVDSSQVVLVAVGDAHFNFLQERQDVMAILVTADEKIVDSFTTVSPLDEIEESIAKFQRALVGTALLLATPDAKVPQPSSPRGEVVSLDKPAVVPVKEKPEKKQSSLAKSAESKAISAANKKSSGSISSGSEASGSRKADSDGKSELETAPKPMRADDWVHEKLVSQASSTTATPTTNDNSTTPVSAPRTVTLQIKMRDNTKKRLEFTSTSKLSAVYAELGGDERIVLLDMGAVRRRFTWHADANSTLESLGLVPSATLIVETPAQHGVGGGGGHGEVTVFQQIRTGLMNPIALFWSVVMIVLAFFKRIAQGMGLMHEAQRAGGNSGSGSSSTTRRPPPPPGPRGDGRR